MFTTLTREKGRQMINDQPSVDFLILADRAEAVNGKLYMMGGGWDHLYLAEFGQQQPISLGVGILVPWNATNQAHGLAVRVETEDGAELISAQLNFTAGRPPTLKPGQSQRVVLAFQLPVKLAALGTYVVKALINDNDQGRKEVVFYADMLPKHHST